MTGVSPLWGNMIPDQASCGDVEGYGGWERGEGYAEWEV